MTQQQEVDSIVKIIADNAAVRAAFVVSAFGKVESCYPQENEKQVGQWAVVLIPYLKIFSQLKEFRFSTLQYREGDLWIGELYDSQFLILLLKTPENPTVFYQNIVFNIQKLHLKPSTDEETNLEGSMQRLLHQATDQIKVRSRLDNDFFGALRKSAFIYFGALGEEWVDQGLESLWITLPIRQRQPMEAIIVAVTKRISHPLKRAAFKRDAADLIKKFLDSN